MKQDTAVVEHYFLLVIIRNEMRRQISSIKLHAFDQFHFCSNVAAFFDSDHPILANLHQSVGKNLTDLCVVVASNRSNLGN